MWFKTILPAAFAIPLLLTGCGGGHYDNPYDGNTWQAVYPIADISAASDTQTIVCNNPPAPLTLKDGAGTTTQTATCTTTIFATATHAAITNTQANYYIISVAIDGNGVVDASVNGTTFTGQCISMVSCPSASAAGAALSVTR
jgi:hypothetical protein